MALEAEKADFIEASGQKQRRRLAREDHSAVLVQLASRISAILKSGAGTGECSPSGIVDVLNDLRDKVAGGGSSEGSNFEGDREEGGSQSSRC